VDQLGQLCHTPKHGYASVATVRRKCPVACGACRAVFISPPRFPQAPVFSAMGPETVDPCGDLTISTSYSSARPLTFEWGCMNDEKLDQAIRTNTGQSLYLAPGTIEMAHLDKEYQITIRATNFLGASSDFLVFTVLKKGSPSPAVTFEPPTLSLYRDEMMLITAFAQFSLCPVPTGTVAFTWTQVSGPEIDPLYFGSGAQFGLPSDTLSAGETYVIAARISMAENPAVSSEKQYTITVLRRPLNARIAGGSTMNVASAFPFSLDASMSRDPDVPDGEESGLNFKWSCEISGGPCLTTGGQVLALGTGSSLTVGGNTLNPTIDTPYLFTVDVSKTGKAPVSAQMPVFTVKGDEVPRVLVGSQFGMVQSDGSVKVNANAELMLVGFCGTGLPAVEVTFEPKNMVTGSQLSGVQYKIYFEYPGSYHSCTDNDCGQLVASSSGLDTLSIEGMVESGWYLVVAKLGGYYPTYHPYYIDVGGDTLELNMVQEMLANQDRVVLSWGHTNDLDLWVYGQGASPAKVGWSVPGRSGGIAGGQVTLDVDNWSGESGPETTQFKNLGNGKAIVWIHHYDDEFTQAQVSAHPAKVDVFCHTCEFAGVQKSGYVTSVTQTPSGMPTGKSWWKVGEFTAPACTENAACERVKWTTCTSDCYSNPPDSLRRVPKPPKEAAESQLQHALRKKSVFARDPPVRQNHLRASQESPSILSWSFNPLLEIPTQQSDHFFYLPSALGYVIPGNRYTARFTCAQGTGTNYAELALVVNTPPRGLPCTVCNTADETKCVQKGAPVFDVFRISCDGWADSDTPLAYQLGYSGIFEGEYQEVLLSWSMQSVRELSFPSGRIEVKSRVRDALGAETAWMFNTITVSTPTPLTFSVKNLLTGAPLPSASFKIYSGFSSIANCLKELRAPTCSDDAASCPCGRLIFSGNVEGGDGRIEFDMQGQYLIVVEASGYYQYASTVVAEKRPIRLPVPMTALLGDQEQRVVLSWGSASDLDIWIDAKFAVQAGVFTGSSAYVGWRARSANYGTSRIQLDVDNTDGTRGPETTKFTSLSEGVFQVWVHHYSGSFTRSEATDSPASVDVFCSQCVDNGATVNGRVTSVTQAASTVPSGGSAWWNVGSFEKTASGTMSWSSCTSNCYSEYRRVRFFVDAFDALTGSRVQGVSAMYYIYSNFPAQYENCDASSCGTEEGTGVVGNTNAIPSVPAERTYLVKVKVSGYYTVYFTSYASLLGAANSNINMVQTLATNQDRVVLSWDYSDDLDLSVLAVPGAGTAKVIDWQVRSVNVGGANIALDVDNQEGQDGPEAIQLNRLESGGTYEIWVAHYSGTFTNAIVGATPASVAVYCFACLDDTGSVRAGLVKTVLQNETDVPESGAKFWKVGQWVPSGSSGKLRWITCTTGCYWNYRTAPMSVRAFELTTERDELVGSYRIYSITCSTGKCEGYESFIDCEERSVCGTLVAEGTVGETAFVRPNSGYLGVVETDGFYKGYFTVWVGLSASTYANLVGTMPAQTNRVVLKWDSTDDLDLWVDVTLNSGTRRQVSYLQNTFTQGGVSVTLDIDNQRGFDGPETTNFVGLQDGTFDVWITHFSAKFTRDNVGNAPASLDVFSFACLNSAGMPASGLVSSTIQKAAQVPVAGAKYWKVGRWQRSEPGTWATMVPLQWKSCTTNCYTDTRPWPSRRSDPSSGDLAKPKPAPLPSKLQHIINQQALNRANVQEDKLRDSAVKPAVEKEEKSIAERRMIMHVPAEMSRDHKPSISQIYSKVSSTSLAPAARQRRRLLTLMQADTESQFAIAAQGLVQDAFERSAYEEINQHVSSLALEIDSRYASNVADWAESSKTKQFILEKFSVAVGAAVKNENYICAALASAQAMGVTTALLTMNSIAQLSAAVENLLTVQAGESLPAGCLESALNVVSKNLQATAEAQCPIEGVELSARNHSGPAGLMPELIDEFETSVNHLSLKAASGLVTGQTRELLAGNLSRHEVSRLSIADLLDVTRAMPAAAGASANALVSYRIPSTLLDEVPALRAATELTVNFGSFHHAPAVSGIQPISPMVGLSLSLDGADVAVQGLTNRIQVTLPIVYQKRCGTPLSANSYRGVLCMYYANSTYHRDGCTTTRHSNDPSIVTCACNHLTNFVVIESELTLTACPLNAALPADLPQDSSAANCRCNAGYTGPNNGNCVACVAGKYKNQPGSAACTFCVKGTYSSQVAAATQTACQACQVGKYSVSEAANSAETCQQCAQGKYSATAGADEELDCTQCAQGKYSDTLGASSSETCRSCPSNAFSPQGSTFLGACKCNAGWAGPDGGVCAQCAVGKYKEVVGSGPCTACEGGSTSALGSIQRTACKCIAGWTGPDGGPCQACLAGTYKATDGSAACTTCPEGSSHSQTGRLSINECNCRAGYFGSPGSCTACIAGKYSAATASTECSNCVAGKFSAAVGATAASTCVDCGAGKYSDVLGAPSGQTCMNCPKGTYLIQTGRTLLSDCTQCAGAKYSAASGATSAGTCSNCPVGKTSAAGSDEFADCNEQCAPGFTGPDGSCTECGAGTYKTTTGSADCIPCPPNTGNEDLGRASCKCNPGFGGSGVELPAPACTVCAAGSYKASYGHATCTPCEAGKYSGQQGATACEACPAGKYSTVSGAIGPNTCEACTADSDAPAGSDAALDCLCNSGYARDGDGCVACAAGKYKAVRSNERCTDCLPGTYLETTAAKTVGQCLACGSGKYSDMFAATSPASCTDCAVGKYSAVQGASSSEMCQNCIRGKYSITQGAPSVNTCVNCLAGKYSATLGAGAESDCTTCEEGKFSNEAGAPAAGACASCLAGTFSNDDRTDCLDCAAGRYSAQGDAVCKSCPKGKYSGAGASVCTLCGAGKYSDDDGATSESTCVACVATVANSTSDAGSTSVEDCTCVADYTGPAGGPCVACKAPERNPEGGSSPCRNFTVTEPPQTTPPPAVRKPTALPAGGKYIGFVEIKLATEAATLVYTTDGSEPKCSSASMSSIKTAMLTLVAKNFEMTLYNLKAISCTSGRSSDVLGETYQVDPGHVVLVSFPIEGKVTAGDLQKDEALREGLLKGIAEVLGIARELLQDVTITDARRRLLAVNLEFGIVAQSEDAANKLQAAVLSADFSKAAAGIPGAKLGKPTVTVRAPGVVVPKTTPAPQEKKFNVLALILGLFGLAGFIALCVAGYLSWKSRRTRSGKPETTFLSGGADSASTSNMQSPDAAMSESRRGRFSSAKSPMSPHTPIRTSSATPAAGTLQMGSDSTPSMPAPRLILDTQRPPQSSEWMEATTPPGTPPGEPPAFMDDSEPIVRGELVFVEPSQLMPWQQRASQDAGVGLLQASGGPARDMRRNLEDADKGLYPALQDGTSSASADEPMNLPVMHSSNQQPEVKMPQEESQNNISGAIVKDLQFFPERPSSDVPAGVAYSRPPATVSTRDSGGGVSMMAPPPKPSFSGDLLFSTMASQESASAASETAKDAGGGGAIEI